MAAENAELTEKNAITPKRSQFLAFHIPEVDCREFQVCWCFWGCHGALPPRPASARSLTDAGAAVSRNAKHKEQAPRCTGKAETPAFSMFAPGEPLRGAR